MVEFPPCKRRVGGSNPLCGSVTVVFPTRLPFRFKAVVGHLELTATCWVEIPSYMAKQNVLSDGGVLL